MCTHSTNYFLLNAWVHNYIPSEAQRHIIHMELYFMTQLYLSLQVIARLDGLLPQPDTMM